MSACAPPTARAIAIERATVRAALLDHQVAFGESLYAALRAARCPRALQRLRAEVVRGPDTRLLELSEGEAVLATERRSSRRTDARSRSRARSTGATVTTTCRAAMTARRHRKGRRERYPSEPRGRREYAHRRPLA